MRGILWVLALAGSVSVDALAQPANVLKPGRLTDPAAISQVLAAMPFNDKSMGYKNLGERVERLGLKVEQIDVARLTADDARDDPDHVQRGDTLLTVHTSEAPQPVLALCPLVRRFQIVKRGARWMPQDRTGNWLVNGHGHCRAPA